MRYILFLLASLFFHFGLKSQNTPEGNIDHHLIRYYNTKPTDPIAQQQLRSLPAWQGFLANHQEWHVHFDELSGLPHRAYGKPISIEGSDLSTKAIQLQEQLEAFGLMGIELENLSNTHKGKYSYVNFRQRHNGLEVLDSRYMVKFFNDKVVAFGCDVHPNISLNCVASIQIEEAANYASVGISNAIISIQTSPELYVLPVPANNAYLYHLVYKIMVKTMSVDGIPANYETLVDAHEGTVLSRRNTVLHEGKPGKNHTCAHHCSHDQMLQVSASVTGDVYLTNPYESIVSQSLENIYITAGGTDYQLESNGEVILPVTPGSTATVQLMGPWSRVYSAGVTPSLNVTLIDGMNAINMNSVSNIKERSAYRSVQRIHDFSKLWLPSTFTGMDFQLTTNIDEAGTCNAFYDGISINFFDIGGGCNASSLIADICYHEYGHGINDNYYQSLGGNFINGAMGEGYADFWAISCTNNPLLGVGFNTEDLEPIRRYDIDPKVYPSDISGEVHGDGEIIMGAWWDTHLLMGSDWNLTMPLFVEAYAGMQAQSANGNEGVAYTDVLLDALQADDDDGDITNGTPHAAAIVEGFYIHGITLISNATLAHNTSEFTEASDPLTINATLNLGLPFYNYLQSVQCFYKINDGIWNSVPMSNSSGNNYTTEIAAQPAGTVIAFYLGAYDVNESLSAVVPIGAHLTPTSNLPFFTLVSVQQMGAHDCDDIVSFGNWQTGVIGDNATTGQWEEDSPIGSYTVDAAPGTMVQTDSQHTPDGEFCFFTGNATSASAGIGENDVDGGRTTLQTPTINMTSYQHPVVAYWRYYTNSPPGGANPNADYWQVRISNNNGSTWTYVENTKVSDMSWRRNAFRVEDYVTPTAQMKMQFIASDSTHAGTNLDGGSLVEAAVDDFVIYDELLIGVDEENLANNQCSIFPNPLKDEMTIQLHLNEASILNCTLMDASGKVVHTFNLVSGAGEQTHQVHLPEFAEGTYLLNLQGKNYQVEKTIYISK